jgi:carboxymethylenebutenolidase
LTEISFPADGGEAAGYLATPASLAIWAAATDPRIRAAVSYYYVMSHGRPDFSKLSAAVLGHFGAVDAFIPLEDAQALEEELRAGGAEAEFQYYEGAGHVFFNDTEYLGTHDAAMADGSWGCTVAFLRGRLGR